MIGVAIVTLLLPALADDAPAATPEVKTSPLAAGMNRFALDLFRAARSPSSNFAIAPASLGPAIAMVYEGARGATAEEIAKVVSLPSDREAMRAEFQALIRRWQGGGPGRPYRLVTASSVWAQLGFDFQGEYLQILQNSYGAVVSAVDFQNEPERARRAINAWVDKKTNRLIPELISPGMIETTTRLVVASAIAFKADWVFKFQAEHTHPADFHVTPDRIVPARTMHQGVELAYAEADDVQVVELPYRGSDFAMVVILPRKADGLAGVEASLTAERLDGWLGKLAPREVNLALPKFQTEASRDLTATLSAMGMPSAFTKSADFSGMSEDAALWISSLIHKAVVKVDEEGTEAAAATAAIMKHPPGPVHVRKPPVEFRADHPFVYAIRDTKTRMILFLGHVVDPTH
jgi:serpin B